MHDDDAHHGEEHCNDLPCFKRFIQEKPCFLTFSRVPGLRNGGLVVAIGVVTCLAATLLLLPAVGTLASLGTFAIGFDPPRYLASGDVVEISIDGIGTLRNPVE